MWQLKMTDRDGVWVVVDSFDSVVAAARRIIELEGYPVSGLFLEAYVATKREIEEECFDHLEHRGRLTKRCYVVKQLKQ